MLGNPVEALRFFMCSVDPFVSGEICAVMRKILLIYVRMCCKIISNDLYEKILVI